jgi:hypothetical protein
MLWRLLLLLLLLTAHCPLAGRVVSAPNFGRRKRKEEKSLRK